MTLGRLATLAILALAFAQLALIGRVELTFDEAYYALWASAPQWGYLDHPPMVAWMIAASEALFGHSEFGVRALFFAMGVAVPALIARTAWVLYADKRVAATAALLWIAAPISAAAPLATPDAPLVYFWTLALAGLAEVHRGRGTAWALVGLAAGAAGLSKMTAGFLGAGVALAVVATPSLRPQLRQRGPYLAAALALAVVAPFIVWNAGHGWATFVKQGARLGVRGFAPIHVLEFAGAAVALLNPITVVATLLAIRRLRGRAPSEPTRILLSTVAPALVYFLIHALHDRVQGHWPAPLFPALLILAARALVAMSMRRAVLAAIALEAVAAAAVYLHLATAWPAFDADPTARIGGWRALTAQVFEVAKARQARFVLARGYAATSLLTFYGPAAPPVGEFGEPERWTFRAPLDASGEGLAFGPPEFADELARRYSHVERVATISRVVAGRARENYALFQIGGETPP